MNKLLSPGVIAGLCTAAAAIATAYQAAPLAAFFNDPATPTHVIAVVGIVGSIVAGFLPSHRVPPAAPGA